MNEARNWVQTIINIPNIDGDELNFGNSLVYTLNLRNTLLRVLVTAQLLLVFHSEGSLRIVHLSSLMKLGKQKQHKMVVQKAKHYEGGTEKTQQGGHHTDGSLYFLNQYI